MSILDPILLAILTNLGRILVIMIIAGMSIYLVHLFLRQVDRRLVSKADPDRKARMQTLLQAIRSILGIVIGFTAGLMALSVVGIDILPLLAGAGVASLALSLGFQSLIRDYLGGFFILIDNHIRVGDWIKVLTVTGQVERITMRAIFLRDQDGNQHMVPNGEIRLLTNMSRDWARILIDLAVPSSADFKHVTDILIQTLDDFSKLPEIKRDLVEHPEVIGWVGNQAGAILIRLSVKCIATKKDQVERMLRERALKVLLDNDIQLV